MAIKRAIIIVLDSVGIGETPDAALYKDEGSNTLGNIVKQRGKIALDNMVSLGLGNIEGIDYLEKSESHLGCYARMNEKSAGKDTTTGHWEIMGLVLDKPFPVYPNGFPDEVIDEFKRRIGRDILGNIPASGTEIINELGEEHMKTGYPIVYTSADSVFQIAAHKSVIPLEELYNYCRIAREILKDEHAVGRVIARPFTGTPGSFTRTTEREDYSLEPFRDTLLDYAKRSGLQVVGVGKIYNIFAGRGVTKSVHIDSNADGIDRTIDFMKEDSGGIIFTNLIDFDMLYGHRNDVEGYAASLEEFDERLPEILAAMREDDVLFITADHGNDPTTPSTDHSREYVPLIVYGKKIARGVNLGTRESLADIAATIAEMLEIRADIRGTSFLKDIAK